MTKDGRDLKGGMPSGRQTMLRIPAPEKVIYDPFGKRFAHDEMPVTEDGGDAAAKTRNPSEKVG